jgi:hypothetical protein
VQPKVSRFPKQSLEHSGVPKCNLGTREKTGKRRKGEKGVAAGFSLRSHRLESLCHRGVGAVPEPPLQANHGECSPDMIFLRFTLSWGIRIEA